MTSSSDQITDGFLINNLHEPLFVVDTDGTLINANERLGEITAVQSEEFVDRPITELSPFIETGFDNLQKAADTVLQGEVDERRVNLVMTHPPEAPVNSPTPAEARLTRLVDKNEIVGVLVVIRDITERERTEEQLRARERRFRAMFEAHSAPMLLIEPESGSIEEANIAAAEFYDYSIEKLTDMTIQQINTYSSSEVSAERRRAQRHNRNHFEFKHRLASGEVRPVEVHSSPVEIDGQELLFSIIYDITERKQRQREYEQIFNSVNDAITVFDPHREKITQVNTAYKDMLGYDLKQIREHGIGGLSVAEEGYTADLGWELIHKTAETGESETTEWKAETNRGEQIWLEVTLTAAEINGEQRVLSIQRDITERKHRQREYEQIFQGVNDGITIHDPDTGEILDANETYLDIFGYDDVETVQELGLGGLSVAEKGYTKQRAQILINNVASSDEPRTVEWQIETASGEQRWFESTVAPAEIGGKKRVLAIQRDITKRKHREQEYEQIFNGVSEIIAIRDLETGEIVDANDSYAKLLGYSRDELQGMSISDIGVTEEGYDDERGQTILNEVMETHDPVEFEWKIEDADGTQHVMDVVGTTATIDGAERYVAIGRDITDQKEREQAIQTVQDATERMQRTQDRTEVAEVAAEAIAEILNPSAVICWLYNTDLDRLEPTATADVSSDIELCDSFAAETALYEWFSGEESVTVFGTEFPFDKPFDTGIAIQLGDHGVILAGRCGSVADDDVLLDIANTLAEHTETALRRVSRAKELRESQRRLSTIIDRIDEAIFLEPAAKLPSTDPSPDFVSSGYADIWGQSLEEIHESYEDGFYRTLHPDDHDDYRAFIEQMCTEICAGEGNERYSQEYRIEQPDGEIRWVHSDFYPTEWGTEPRILVVSRDCTDRKQRARTLESFHDATAELTTAESITDACCIAVDAAAEVLDLPATAVYYYDETTATLEARATGPRVGSTDDLPVVSATETAPWEAFASESMERVTATDNELIAHGPSDDALFLPLGANGLLVVWQTDESLDTNAASILGATVEAALNRLRGERQLESRQEELTAQTERAERLDAITELTQRVEAAITTHSSRSAIQEAVCSEVVDVDPYTGAWIGAAEVGSDKLTPRAVAGIDKDRGIPTLRTAKNEHSDPHPAFRAWTTDEPHIVNTVVKSGRRDGWREVLIRQGFGSLCAVPLSYNGTTYGVLTILAEEPETFADQDMEVVSQLGTSIGYAITALERQRALESDDTVELQFEGSESEIPFAQLAADAGCIVQHERTVYRQDDRVSVYYRLQEHNVTDPESIAEQVFTGTVSLISDSDSETMIERTGGSWFGSLISEYGGILRDGIATESSVTLSIEVPQEGDIRTIVEQLTAEYQSLELTAKRQHTDAQPTPRAVRSQLERELTDRQYEALETGYAMGYFEWPRRSSGEEIADQLGITQPTVNKHIRLGESRLFDLLFDPNS